MTMATTGTYATFDHWWTPEGRRKIIQRRRSWRASLKIYLEKVPLVDGLDPNIDDQFPQATMLADAYVRLVRGELAHHDGDPTDALWTGMLFGPLFAHMWAISCNVKLSTLPIPNGIHAFQPDGRFDELATSRWLHDCATQLPEYQLEDWIAQETLETADLLARAFVKAFAEFRFVCAQVDQNPMVIRHHSALLAEYINEMLSLVVQGGEQTDLRLPDNHIHKRISEQQKAASQAASSTLEETQANRGY